MHRQISTKLISVAIWTSFAVLSACVWQSRFMTNDDVIMSAFASGAYTGRPTAHLVFIGTALGGVIASLYGHFGSVPWYAITLFGVNIVALAAMSTELWTRRSTLGRPATAMAGLVLACWASVAFLRPSFTGTAFSIAAAGLFVACTATDAAVAPRWPAAAFGAVCLAVAASVRWDSMLGAVVILIPYIASRTPRSSLRYLLRFCAFAAALVGIVSLTNVLGDQAPGWATYRDFNDARSELHQTVQLTNVIAAPHEPEVAAMLQANDWTVDDVTLLSRWLFEQPDVYDTAKINRLVDVARTSRFSGSWGQAWTIAVRGTGPMMVVLGAATVLASLRCRRAARCAVLQLAWFTAIAVYVAHQDRFPERVGLPLALIASMAILLNTDRVQPDSRRAEAPQILLVALAAVSMWVSYNPFATAAANLRLATSLNSQISTLRQADTAGVFVVVGAPIALEGQDALDTAGVFANEFIMPTGWASQSPSQLQRLERVRLSPDLLTSLLDQPHRYVVISHRLLEPLSRVYLDRHDRRVKFIRLTEVSATASAYRVVTLSNVVANSASRRAPKPVDPRDSQPSSLSLSIGPAMSRCAHGTSATNS